MAFLVAQAFINGLNNPQHKQMLDLVLLDDLYTFQEVKVAVRKLHSRSPGITPAFAYPAAVASIQPDPITAMTQAFRNVCNEMRSQVPPARTASPSGYPGRGSYPCQQSSCYSLSALMSQLPTGRLPKHKHHIVTCLWVTRMHAFWNLHALSRIHVRILEPPRKFVNPHINSQTRLPIEAKGEMRKRRIPVQHHLPQPRVRYALLGEPVWVANPQLLQLVSEAVDQDNPVEELGVLHAGPRPHRYLSQPSEVAVRIA